MSRFEAASLLSNCLDKVIVISDELDQLIKEFRPEMAMIRGNVDGLEARVGELEASKFSATTKLVGHAVMVLGASHFMGVAKQSRDPWIGKPGENLADAAARSYGSTVLSYDLRLNLNTSFTGKDLLRSSLRASNFAPRPFGGGGYVGLDTLDVVFGDESGMKNFFIEQLFYQAPLGRSFTITTGPRVRQDDMLAFRPSAYPADAILDLFPYAGAPGAYS